MCHTPKKAFYKRFLNEPFPVESHIDHSLHDQLCAEIVTKTIENKQDAVDYMTWTFMYRRLTQNPNYYNLKGTSHSHISDHLSELVENTLADLEQARCISIENDFDIQVLNLGMIASYYYVQYTTIELFSSSLTAETRLRGLIEILVSAAEFDTTIVRHKDDILVEKLAMHCPLKMPAECRYTDPHIKVNVLLQSYLSRRSVGFDFTLDTETILVKVPVLLQSIVDVIASSGWLSPALAAMELSQMCIQGVWDQDSPLLQLPHFSRELAHRCTEAGIEGIFDLMEMHDAERLDLLQMEGERLMDVARMCNRYPNIDVSFNVEDADNISAGENVTVIVELEREGDEEGGVPRAHAPRFPRPKDESWWLVVGEVSSNVLYAIKKVSLPQKAKISLDFQAPERGDHTLTMFLMCDCYIGCDQEYEIPLTVREAHSDSGSGDEEEIKE